MQVEKQPVTTEETIEELYQTVKVIWREVFTPIIGSEQVDYMLANYQSPANIAQEIQQGAHYFLLKVADVVVGYTAYEESVDQIYLSKLYLAENFRGQGLSREIFDWYEELGRGKTLHLNVNRHNHQAIAVYEHRGFEKVGERELAIGEGFVMEDIIYEKKLA